MLGGKAFSGDDLKSGDLLAVEVPTTLTKDGWRLRFIVFCACFFLKRAFFVSPHFILDLSGVIPSME